MALIHNNLLSVFSGVSKQSIDQRLPNNCEEMINIYPTIHDGLRRRNPTEQISTTIIPEYNQFTHFYDRGLSGDTAEQYLITIDKTNGLRVLDIQAGVYKTVSYSGSALKYLESSNPEIGFSAITVKDTTFIANKDIVPKMEGVGAGATINTSTINFNMTSYAYNLYFSLYVNTSEYYGQLAPARVRDYTTGYFSQITALGATTTVVVDGINVSYTTKVKESAYNYVPESMLEFRTNIMLLLNEKLDSSKYRAELELNGGLKIYKLDGTSVVVSYSISFPTTEPTPPPNLGSYTTTSISNKHSTPITSFTSGSFSGNLGLTSDYDSKAHIWIKSVSPDTTFPYTFTLILKETNGTTISTFTSNATTSVAVASAFATSINTPAIGFTATSSGSVVKIIRNNGAKFEIVLSDTFGSQASVGFIGSVTSMDDLPKHFPFKDTIVKVDGLDRLDENAYWVKYDGNSWVEHRDPKMNYKIIDSTMPHKLVRNSDFTFTLSVSDYSDMLVGDANTNPIPEFIGSQIKDLFFVNGRLGILTKNGISLSQQGEFGNFFRTTILQLLDDSAITTFIDSNKSVGLEYATELGDSIVIFGDKQQFSLDASKGITPSNISVSPIAGYEINKNVRPISHGDSVYFIVQRGAYSSLMKMDAATLSTTMNAEDVSSHVAGYIDGDVVQLVGSIRNQVIFVRSRSLSDTIYVFKSHMEDREDKQRAWSKWVLSSNIKNIFALDKYLYIFGSRYVSLIPVDEFTFALSINFSKTILFETSISYGQVQSTPSFEKINIDPYSITHLFKDNGLVRYNSEVELSEWYISDRNNIKETSGTLLVKTIKVSSKEGSDFSLIISDKERKTSRVIPSIYTVGRNPYVSGNSKNMKIKIKSNNGNGFQINSISLEGQYNNRSSRI